MKVELILDVLSKKYGLNKKLLYAYGDLNGYSAIIKESAEGYLTKLYVTFTMKMTYDQKENIRKFLEDFNDEEQGKLEFYSKMKGIKLFKTYSIEQYFIVDDAIQFKFHASTKNFKEKFYQFVDWITDVLEKEGIAKNDLCSICGKEIDKDVDWYLVNYKVYHAHEKCIDYLNEKNEIANDAACKESDGTYLSGIIGAIVGCVVGSLIYILAGVFFNSIYAFVFTSFITMGAIFGYKKFNGRRTKNKKMILIPIVLFTVLLAEISRVVITVLNEITKYYGKLIPLEGIIGSIRYVVIDCKEYRFMLMNIVLGFVWSIATLLINLKNEIGELNKLKIKKLK